MAWGEAHHLSRSSRPPPHQSHCSWLWCHWMKPRKLVGLWEWTTNHHVPMETQRWGWRVLIGGRCVEGVGIYVVAVETGWKPRPLRAWGRLQTAAAATMDRAQTNESGSIFINKIFLIKAFVHWRLTLTCCVLLSLSALKPPAELNRL